MIKRIAKRLSNLAGFEVVRLKKFPSANLVGLRRFDFKTIIDIGANEGQFARRFTKEFPDAVIYCFEPLPSAFRSLRQWVEAIRESRIHPFNLALGDWVGGAQIQSHTSHLPSSSLLQTTDLSHRMYPFTIEQQCLDVEMTTLDLFFEDQNLPIEGEVLVKLDVQGYEDRVIMGGRRTLGRARACIVEVSVDSLYVGQASFMGICGLMDALGFHYAGNLDQTYADDGHVIFFDAVFVRSTG